MLTVLWPAFDAAPLGDRPEFSEQISRRQVLIGLRYLDRLPVQQHLARRSSSEVTSKPKSLERRDPVQNLALRVAQNEHMRLMPYRIGQSLMAADVKDSEAALGLPYAHDPKMEPHWYVAPSGSGQLTSFISFDPTDRAPDELLVEGNILQRSSEGQIVMCRHSMVDLDDSITVEMPPPAPRLGHRSRRAAVSGNGAS